MMRYTMLLVVLLVCGSAQAQVNVVEDKNVEQMLNNFTSSQKAEPYVKGYRIQIITTPDRRKMESMRAKFTSTYPDVFMEWEHVSPYYQVRVGAYETKMDLMQFMIELKQSFKEAIPVVCDIQKSEIIASR